MTLQQIQYVQTCADAGSITGAAQFLFTSPSNISKSLSLLEAEIGYTIFSRSKTGLSLTKKGEEFLRHSKVILEEFRQISNLASEQKAITFSCACSPHPACFDAFIKLCNTIEASDSKEFTLYQGLFFDCCERVLNNLCSLGVIIIPAIQESTLTHYLERNHLLYTPLKTLGYNVNLRKDHPFLQKYPDKTSVNFQELSAYPYVDYDCSGNDPLYQFRNNYNYISINPRQVYHTNSLEWKIKIISNSDAFSIGIQGSKLQEKKSNWVCIPLEGWSATLYSVKSETTSLNSQESLYLDLLKAELDNVDSFFVP